MQTHGNKPQDAVTLPAQHKMWYQSCVSVTSGKKSHNGMIYCVGCLRALCLTSASLCHLHVPDFALFFVFLFFFSYFYLVATAEANREDIERPLHEAPLVLSSSLGFRSFPEDYDVHNRSQKTTAVQWSTVGKMSIFPWGSKELARPLYTTSSCPFAALGFVMLLG